MAVNLFFTAVGIPVRDAAACLFTVNGTNRSFSTFQEDIADSTAVYILGITAYVAIGMIIVLVDRGVYIKHNSKHNRKKKFIKLKKLKWITDWR